MIWTTQECFPKYYSSHKLSVSSELFEYRDIFINILINFFFQFIIQCLVKKARPSRVVMNWQFAQNDIKVFFFLRIKESLFSFSKTRASFLISATFIIKSNEYGLEYDVHRINNWNSYFCLRLRMFVVLSDTVFVSYLHYCRTIDFSVALLNKSFWFSSRMSILIIK